MDDIEEQLREFYQGVSLRSVKVDEILKKEKQIHRQRWNRFVVRVASIAAAVIILIPFLREGPIDNQLKEDFASTVVREVAKNHKKKTLPTFETQDYSKIDSMLTDLKFSVVPGEPFQNEFELIGCRYCSIQSHLSAQIKLKNELGKICTLYVVPASPTFRKSIRGQVRIEKETAVKLWWDDNRLFALAQPLAVSYRSTTTQ